MTRFKIAASLSAVTDDVLVFHFGPASPQPFDELLFLL